jgi:hypothetical protein
MLRMPHRIAAALAVALAAAPGARAQERPTEFESWNAPGWTFTPAVSVGGLWDSNVAIAANQAAGQPTARDTLFVLEPHGQLEFRDNRTEFFGGYKGYVRRYMDVDALNGFDQRLFLSFQRLATKRVTFFVRNDWADVPSTDDVDLNGVPYARVSSRSNRLSAGIESRLSKYDDLAVRYENTWVAFDDDDASVFLRGGVLNGVRVDYGRRLSERTVVGAEYRIRHSSMNAGTRAMWFHDVGATAQYAFGPHVRVQGAAGYSLLRDERVSGSQSGAYFRGELTRQGERSTAGAYYERSYAPTFGFGGSSQSQELRGYLHMPVTRNRFYVQASAGWRRTNPLVVLDEIDLDAFVVDSTLGMAASRWLRVEVFHAYTRQDSRVTGGEINRHRAGAQIVISQPVRIR